MLGIDFPELVVCGVVALVVLGPERMPEAIRTTSLWVGRVKRSLRETIETIEREIGVDDIRQQLNNEDLVRSLDDMNKEIDSALFYDRTDKKTEDQHQALALKHETTTQSNAIQNKINNQTPIA